MSRRSLSDALGNREPPPSPATAAPGAAESPTGKYVPPSRRGKRRVSVDVDPAVVRQLKEVGLQLEDRSTQSMLVEAINDFFVKHGRSPLA